MSVRESTLTFETKASTREALFAELEVHKAEFATLREEILQWLDAERQYLNFTLLGVSAGMLIIPILLAQKEFVILLLYPILFHALLAEMLRSFRTVSDLTRYIVDILIPRVNEVLDKLGDERDEFIVLGWELQSAKRPLKSRMNLLRYFAPTGYWVPILAICTMLATYGIIVAIYSYSPSSWEILLVIINLLFLSVIVVPGLGTGWSKLLRARKLLTVDAHHFENQT